MSRAENGVDLSNTSRRPSIALVRLSSRLRASSSDIDSAPWAVVRMKNRKPSRLEQKPGAALFEALDAHSDEQTHDVASPAYWLERAITKTGNPQIDAAIADTGWSLFRRTRPGESHLHALAQAVQQFGLSALISSSEVQRLVSEAERDDPKGYRAILRAATRRKPYPNRVTTNTLLDEGMLLKVFEWERELLEGLYETLQDFKSGLVVEIARRSRSDPRWKEYLSVPMSDAIAFSIPEGPLRERASTVLIDLGANRRRDMTKIRNRAAQSACRSVLKLDLGEEAAFKRVEAARKLIEKKKKGGSRIPAEDELALRGIELLGTIRKSVPLKKQ
jgi:hypothetical protein